MTHYNVFALFRSPVPVSGSFLCHTTNKLSAKRILHERSFTGKTPYRPHDSLLRRDDSPPVIFFTALDTLYSVTPLPSFAEPGEVVTSILVSLNIFAQTPQKYRMYLVSAAPPQDSKQSEQTTVRVTLLFARETHCQWCEERGMIELDIWDNNVLSCARDESGIGISWHMASHVLYEGIGLRPTKVVIAVAGDKFPFDSVNSIPNSPWTAFDAAHVFRVRAGNITFLDVLLLQVCACCDQSGAGVSRHAASHIMFENIGLKPIAVARDKFPLNSNHLTPNSLRTAFDAVHILGYVLKHHLLFCKVALFSRRPNFAAPHSGRTRSGNEHGSEPLCVMSRLGTERVCPHTHATCSTAGAFV